MEDKLLMEGLLFDMKVMADLCLHGAIESSTEEVHKTFIGGLKDILSMQNSIYQMMSEEGYYTMQNVEKTKIDQAKQKFAQFIDTLNS